MCATSIGFTFSQSPSPGVLKSGIPDGTEIPAPVSATVHCDCLMSSASCSAAAVDVGVILEDVKTVLVSERMTAAAAARGPPPLLASPVRRALTEECGDPLLGVLGEERRGEALLLGLDPLVEIALVGNRLDLLDGERCLLGQLACPGQGDLE